MIPLLHIPTTDRAPGEFVIYLECHARVHQSSWSCGFPRSEELQTINNIELRPWLIIEVPAESLAANTASAPSGSRPRTGWARYIHWMPCSNSAIQLTLCTPPQRFFIYDSRVSTPGLHPACTSALNLKLSSHFGDSQPRSIAHNSVSPPL